MRNKDTGQLSAAERIELLNEILIRQGLLSVLPKKKTGSGVVIRTSKLIAVRKNERLDQKAEEDRSSGLSKEK